MTGSKMLSACIEWGRYVGTSGYGRVTVNRKPLYAHRQAYVKAFGEIPAGKYVYHKCDNKKCVNPEHLFIGTQLQNMQDCKAKGRIARGFRLPFTKLSETDIAEIIKRSKSGERYVSIAKDYPVNDDHISRLARKAGITRYWKRSYLAQEEINGEKNL